MIWKHGKCENCGFAGLTVKKAMVPVNDLTESTAYHDQLPVLLVCMTCYHTPAGVESENKTHRRLPSEEYTK